MDIPPTSENDVLAQSIRALLFQALAELRRPATTQELAARIGRHPNTPCTSAPSRRGSTSAAACG